MTETEEINYRHPTVHRGLFTPEERKLIFSLSCLLHIAYITERRITESSLLAKLFGYIFGLCDKETGELLRFLDRLIEIIENPQYTDKDSYAVYKSLQKEFSNLEELLLRFENEANQLPKEIEYAP